MTVYDIQKAGAWKRMSAYLFDTILLGIVAVGVAFLLTVVFRYDAHVADRDGLLEEFEAEYGVELDITQSEYEEMTEAEKTRYDDAYRAFVSDPEVNAKEALIVSLTLLIIVFGLLVSFLLLELLIPLKLGNGQTLGKKIFGIGVMRVDGVKISVFQLFVRSVLGKYTLETMLPIFLVLLFFFNVFPFACLVGLAFLALLQLAFVLVTQYHTPIHDMIAGTLTVDFASQMIFDSVEEMTAYKQRIHAEMAQKAEYR